jgi:hypothetical protein
MLSVHTVKMKIILCVLVFTQYVAVVDGTCMQGYYGPNGRAPCTPCGAGTYNSQTGSTSCLNCGAGRYSSAGSGGCSACGAGTASATVTASGPSTCIKCLAGTWANGGASTCTNCLAGKYSTTIQALNVRTCLNCQAGTWSAAASAACNMCPAGTYSATVGATSQGTCLNCPIGRYSNVEGANLCIPCVAGTYGIVEGAVDCNMCPATTYSATVGASDISTCINCPTGKTRSGVGGDSIESCVDIRCESPQQNDEFLDLLVIKPPVGINIFSQYNARTVPDARGFAYDVAIGSDMDSLSVQDFPLPGYVSTAIYTTPTVFTQTGTTCCDGAWTIQWSSAADSRRYKPSYMLERNAPEYALFPDSYCCANGRHTGGRNLNGDYPGEWLTFKSTTCFSMTTSKLVGGDEASYTHKDYRIYGRNYDTDRWTVLYDHIGFVRNAPAVAIDLDGACYRQYGLVIGNMSPYGIQLRMRDWIIEGKYVQNAPIIVTTTADGNAVNPVAAVYGPVGVMWAFPTLPATHTVCSTMRYTDTNTLNTTDWMISCYTNGIVGASRYVNDQVDSGEGVISSPYNMLADREYTIHSMFTWDRTLSNRDMKVVTAAMRRELGGVPTSQTTAVIPITNLNNYKVRLLDTVAVSPLRLSSYCVVCPLGRWVNTDGDCQNCPAGSSSTTVNARNASACIGCPAGTYSATDGAVCTGCPAGKYGTTVGATSCTEICPAGTYSATIGASDDSTCLNCSSGSYSNDGSATCTSCSAGTSSATVAATSINTCIACTAGTYSGSRAATCSNCPIGSYSSVVGATSIGICTNCVAGKYGITLGAVDSSTCTKCMIGTYSTTVRASSNATCINCPESTFGTAEGLSSPAQCTNCPAGTTSVPGSFSSTS